jgi:hypothetical protein
MDKLNLPSYSFRISKAKDERLFIFDSFRRKHVRLTPEEWVRQNILEFLVSEKKVPRSLVSSEAGVRVNTSRRRYDALIFDHHAEPWMLIECKAPTVVINQRTFDQIVAYNKSIQAKYILVTNGLKHYCCRIDNTVKKTVFLQDIPDFNDS